VASSINKLGQWCIEVGISLDHLNANEKFKDSLAKTFQALIDKGLRLMDTDNPRIAMPLIKLFAFYMKHKQRIKFV